MEPGPAPLFTAPESFERQLDVIAASGVAAFTAAGIAAALRAGELPERAVAITFDDGFASVAEKALPLLRERGLPATVFCVAGHLGGSNDFEADPPAVPRRPLASADELRQAAAESGGLLELGCHGMRHLPLSGLAADGLGEELLTAADRLEERLGAPVRSLAYPYTLPPGEEGMRLVRERYDAAFAGGLAPLRAGADPHLLPRVDAHYLRRPGLLERALEGRLGGYLGLRRTGARLRRLWRADHVPVS